MDAATVGDLLDFGRDAVLLHVGESSPCAEELLNLFAANNVDWYVPGRAHGLARNPFGYAFLLHPAWCGVG